MATTTVENFKCMMCGHEYTDQVEKGEDKERSCPKCRSNSIRHLKKNREVLAQCLLTARPKLMAEPPVE